MQNVYYGTIDKVIGVYASSTLANCARFSQQLACGRYHYAIIDKQANILEISKYKTDLYHLISPLTFT